MFSAPDEPLKNPDGVSAIQNSSPAMNVASNSPVEASHNRTVESLLPESTRVPSGE